MFPISHNEGMHRSAGLQARHRGTFPECLPGLDGHEILAAVHNLGHDVSGAEIHVLQFRGKTQMHHLRGRDKKRVRGLCKTDSGACPPKGKNHHCDFTCWVLSVITALYSVPFIIILCCHV